MKFAAMRHLERYTPEICSQLRQMAERRQWKDWRHRDGSHEELLEDLKLTYHLHIAAQASGARAGMPPMPPFPAGFVDMREYSTPSLSSSSALRREMFIGDGTNQIAGGTRRLWRSVPPGNRAIGATTPFSSTRTFSLYLGFMSTQRAMPGGRVDRQALPKGSNGRCLCRWCNLEVPAGRLTFCSAWCVEEWKLRSNPGHLRERVFERDRGICAACGLDCVIELRRVKRLRGAARIRAAEEWGMRGRKTLWDADHVTPVAEGGGECDLSNMRTLCLKCHRLSTEELRQRLRRHQSLQAAKT